MLNREDIRRTFKHHGLSHCLMFWRTVDEYNRLTIDKLLRVTLVLSNYTMITEALLENGELEDFLIPHSVWNIL